MGLQVIFGHITQMAVGHTHLWDRDDCGSLPLPPADQAKSTLSHLAHAGGAAPAAPRCRVLGRDSDQVSGSCPEHLGVATAGCVSSQGSESNNSLCLIAMPSSEVIGTTLVPVQVPLLGADYDHL